MQKELDLIIVGGGLAGFSAALEAGQAGRKVLLLEKMSETGGSSAMSGGCLAFAGTDLQKAQGVNDSDALLFDDLREVGKFENDESLVECYVKNQLDTYEWLKKAGVKFSPLIETSSGQSVPRVHNVDPADTVRTVAARALETGNVQVLTGAAAQRLIVNDQGRITGVTYVHTNKEQSVSSRSGVLLASGGFCKNLEMVHRYAPQYDNAVFIGGEQEIDRRARAAPARFRRVAPDFAVMPAFRMRRQIKRGNDLRGGYARIAQVNHS